MKRIFLLIGVLIGLVGLSLAIPGAVLADTADVEVKLNSVDGSTAFQVKDSTPTSVVNIDSDGNIGILTTDPKGYIQIDDKFVMCNTFTSAGINAAIDALGIEGGEVYLPEGEYNISATVLIDYNNTTLRGAGKGTILKLSGAVNCISAASKTNVTIKDMQIDGFSQNAPLVVLNGADHFVLENVIVRNGGNVGVQVLSCDYGKVVDCDIYSNTNIGLQITTASLYNVITGNSIYSNSNIGLQITGASLYNVITGNSIYSNSNIGFQITGSSLYNTITGNVIYNNTLHGIELIIDSDSNVFSGNSITSNVQTGLRIYSDYNVISGNTISGNSTTGDHDNIYMDGAEYNTITGNEICNAGGGGAENCDGITINASSHYNTVTGNVIKDNGDDEGWNCAIEMWGDYNTIAGNLLYCTGTSCKSLEINDGSNNNLVGGNKLKGVFTEHVNCSGNTFEITGASPLTFEGATNDANEMSFSVANFSTDRTFTIGDVNVTLADTTEDYVLTYNDGTKTWAGEVAGGGGSPGGSDTQLQYNNGGAFGGIPELTYDDTAGKKFIQISDKLIICNTFTSAGINNAIDALGIEGGEVYLPEGEYNISASILIDYNNTTLRGAGKGTILKLSGAVNCISAVSKTNLTIKDMQIDGFSQNAVLVVLNGADYFVLENVIVRNGGNIGVQVISCDYGKLVNCDIYSNTNIGLQINASLYNVITGNSIYSNSNMGLQITGSSLYNTITGNIISNSTFHGIQILAGSNSNVINDNIIKSNVQAGLRIESDYNVISGNTITGNSTTGDQDNIFLNSAEYNTITGNEICDAAGGAHNCDGIEINDTSNYNTISGNIIKDNGSDAGYNCAIMLSGDSNTIIGNLLKGTGSAGKSLEIASGANTNLIGGNRCLSTVTDASTDSVFKIISDVSFTGNVKPKKSIYLSAGGATLPTSGYAEVQDFAGTNFTYRVLAFDKDSDEKCYWKFAIPDNFTGTTVTFTFYWTTDSGSASQTVAWEVDTGGFANDEAWKTGVLGGTALETSDTWIANGDLHTVTSSAMTCGWTAGDMAVVYLFRDVSSDTIAGDCYLIGVKIEYGISSVGE